MKRRAFLIAALSAAVCAADGVRMASEDYVTNLVAAISGVADVLALNTNAYLAVSNQNLQIVFRGTNGTEEVVYSWDAIAANRAIAANAAATTNLAAQVARKIETPASWASFAASGATNDQYAVLLDRPSVVFTDGTVQWTSVSNYFFLTAHDGFYTASGSSSQFRIGTDADDWFGLEVTASYLVDILPNSISIVSNIVTVGVLYDQSYDAEDPHVYFTPTLGSDFTELDSGVSWAQVSTNYIATISGIADTYPAGFFKVKAMHAGGAVFRSTVPVFAEGYRVEKNGAYIDTKQPDSVITVTQGGKQYKFFAQEVVAE